jgi:sodium transport system permease protein
MIIFIYSGCLAVAPESIAGEKERGTIATLLVTQIKRSELAMGKILSLMVIALLCGLSSLLGMVLSIRKLIGSSASDVNISYYTVVDYLLLIIVVLSTILFIVSILTNVSAFARSVKEAMTIANPMMVVVMLAGITSMLSINSDPVYYLIPIYNSAQCISGILAFNCDLLNTGITIVSNLTYSAVGVVMLSRMFNNERIVFTR